MFFVVALAVTGLFLVFLEFFLPGAIMAIGGGLLLISSLFVYYMTYSIDIFFGIYCLGLGAALYSVIKIGMRQVNLLKKEIRRKEKDQS